jgi:RHS repeat-associated protein
LGQETRDYTVDVRAEKVLQKWYDTTLLWNNQPKTTGVALALGDDDPELLERSWWMGKGPQGLYTFDLTDAVKEWMDDGGDENFGVMLKAEDEEETQENFLQFASLSYTGEVNLERLNSLVNSVISYLIAGGAESLGITLPYIPDLVKIRNIPIHVNRLDAEPIVSIHYISTTGLENYYSYETMDMGRSGAGYVNHYNGALTYVQPTAEMGGERMPVGLSHVYNSNHDRSDGELWNMKTGVGFRMSLFEQINPINTYESLRGRGMEYFVEVIDWLDMGGLGEFIIEAIGTPRHYYTMVDGDGTEHCFVQHEDRDKRDQFLSEVNKKIVLKKVGDTIEIEDEYGNKKIYSDWKLEDLGWDELNNIARRYRFLNTIRDANGNETNIFYQNGRISRIVDTIGREFKFEYDGDGYLTKIIDQNNRITQYSYNKSDYYVPVLSQITYHDSQTARFTYSNRQDTNADDWNRTRLEAVSNPDDHHFEFELTKVPTSRRTNYRVDEIKHGIGGSVSVTPNPDIVTPGIVIADKTGNFWQRAAYWISWAVYQLVWTVLLRPSWLQIDDHGRWYILFDQPDDPIYGDKDDIVDFNFEHDVSTVSLDYKSNRTTVISSLGETKGITYVFDRAGRAVGAKDNTTGDNAFMSYTSSGGVQNLPGFAAGAAVVHNLLGNPSNEGSGGNWKGGTTVTADAFAGIKSWKISSGQELKYSNAPLERGATYTLSLMAKQAAGSGGATAALYYGEDPFPLDLTDTWDRFTVTFKSNSTKLDFSVEAIGGDVLVDAAQLEKNGGASPFNYLANSHFDTDLKTDEWQIAGKGNDDKRRKIAEDGKDINEVVIHGEPQTEKALWQQIPLNGNAVGQMLLFGATASIVSVREKAEKTRVSVEFLNAAGNVIPLEDRDADEEEDEQYNNVKDNRVFANFNRDIRPSLNDSTDIGLQTTATAYLIPKNAVSVKLYISYDNQAGESVKDAALTRNAMRVRNAFAYIGAGGTNVDYLDGKLDQVTTGGGIANYTWDGPKVTEVEVKRPPTKREIDGIERLDERVEKIEYTYGESNTKNKFNVIKSVESKEDGEGSYLLTETTYDYKTAGTNSYNRVSNSLTAREIGGILTESNVRTFKSSDGATPAIGVMPLTNKQTVAYTNDGNDVARVDDSSTGQWVEYSYESRNHNIPTEVRASDESRSTYHYNEGSPALSNAFDILTGVRAYDGADVYQNEYDFTGFGSGNNDTISGLLESIKHNDTEYSFAYDVFGQVENVKIGGQALVENTYAEEDGQRADGSPIRRFALEETSYKNGFTYAPSYDERGRVVAERWNGAAAPNFAYAFSGSGTLSRAINNETSQETQFGYDMQGRLTDIYTESKVPSAMMSNRVRLGLNGDGQLEDFRLAVNGGLLSRVRYDYDDFDRLSATLFMGRELKYNYSPVTSRLIGTSMALNGDEAKTVFTYDDRPNGGALLAGNVLSMTNDLPGAANDTTYAYAYKPGSSHIESISVNGAPQHAYEYDKIGQLKSDNTTLYDYDLGGNLRAVTENGVVTKILHYDNPGWRDQLTAYTTENATKTLAYDAIGNLAQYDGHTYTWQKGSQLASISGNVNAQYTYDYTGLRSSKTVDGVKTDFVWAGGLLMAQIGSDGNVIAWSYDQGGKMLGFTLDGVPYFYLRNLQGDVVAIHDVSGNVVATYEYDALGNILTADGVLALINPIRYRGYYHDSETGYYYCQSRYYNPEWCRWISADVLMDTGDGILGTNMYAYCYNNPISYIDFGGEMAELAMAGAGAAGGAMTAVGGMAAAGGVNAWNPIGWVLLGAAAVTAVGVGVYFGVQYANDVALTNSINLMNFASSAATPPPPNRGGKGTQVSSKTLYNKKGYRIDVENPGNRLGQIHVQVDGKK